MNKNSKKIKEFPRRLLALMLCCFCFFATVPTYAFELETETDTQQDTSDETIESFTEDETDIEVEKETVTETSSENSREIDTETVGVLFSNKEPKEPVSTYENVNPDVNYILVSKTFEGISSSQIPADFEITVAQEAGEPYILTGESANISEDGLTWKWKINNVGAGKYTVSESNAEIENYDLTPSGLGVVEVKAADFQVSYSKETTCSHKNWPVAIDGDQNVLFAAALTGGGCVVISKEPLTATQRETVAEKVISIGGNWKAPVSFYSISTNGNGPWSIDGKSLYYNPDTGEIILSKTSDWTHVATVSYSISEASNPDIEVKNTYIPNARNLTVKKTVSGNMYDADKEFTFTVTADKDLTYGETIGRTITFNLKKDEETTITVPVGAVVNVTENPDGYIYSFVSITDGVTKEDITNGVSFTMPAENVTVVINNDKNITVDTGIYLETLPYILILGVVAVGVVLMIKKRKNRDDD